MPESYTRNRHTVYVDVKAAKKEMTRSREEEVSSMESSSAATGDMTAASVSTLRVHTG
jgi:hypothetical protein